MIKCVHVYWPPVCSTVSLLDETAVGVDPGATVLLLGLLLAEPQDVLQAVQSHLDDLGVHHRQKIAQRLDAAQVHQVSAGTEVKQGGGGGNLASVSEGFPPLLRDGCAKSEV